ncbi:hypothetical protein CANTEDRAFT_112494 [Yamadazyma tenuis ATCC 10573]|uniref:Uncharacterized protein n=2 Tax=Candida tenuis TaxID=2315449 RepID=G3AZN2_CANTC|nr:uncharacterized protein CANTEDRAFT_112494 [Yamadazyma tenuis ATCC 10573]EGV65628.1 hypothetical protein CANTEDRAFT_112494 [Yamadazyma tenuis ATCC 10573]
MLVVDDCSQVQLQRWVARHQQVTQFNTVVVLVSFLTLQICIDVCGTNNLRPAVWQLNVANVQRLRQFKRALEIDDSDDSWC